MAAESRLQPTGLLSARYRIDRPLAYDGTTVLTAHLVNVCEAPLRLAIGPFTYQPLFVFCALPAARDTSDLDHAVWGPDTGRSIPLAAQRVLMSGVDADGRPPRWPDRDGIILLQDEGYARRVTFLPGWIAPDAVPAARKGLVITLSPPVAMALPKLEPGAVAPGRLIDFADPADVYAPGGRLIPYQRRAKADAADDAAEPTPHESGLRILIELPEEVEARRDIAVTYLVGNTGTSTIWIRQNALVPALATWEVERRGKPVALIDGAALNGMLDLLPERAPLALNPGEWLTFSRVLLASSLPLKPRDVCTLRLRLHAAPASARCACVCTLRLRLHAAPASAGALAYRGAPGG